MTKIQLANITSELTHLWDNFLGEKKSRASLFNLVIYTQKNERSGFYDRLIKKVISKFPCRVILIIAEQEAAEPYLKTDVRAETLGEGHSQIFCEIITIEVSQNLQERVYFILLPHLLCDLPVYLLWTEDPSIENEVLKRLEPIATRIIFDPDQTEDIQSYAKSCLKFSDCIHCDIGDLNWSVLSSWRKIFATTFDHPTHVRSLQEATKIQITFATNRENTLRHQEIEATYFQGWLASVFGWKFKSFEESNEKSLIRYEGANAPLEILLIPEKHRDVVAGTLLSIEIENSKNLAHWIFKNELSLAKVKMQFSDKQRCDLPQYFPLGIVEEGAEIINELFYPQTGRRYKQVLELLSQIPWKRK